MIQGKGIPGLSQSCLSDIASLRAMEDIKFGGAVFTKVGEEGTAYATATGGAVFAGVALVTNNSSGLYEADTQADPTVNPDTGLWNTPVTLSGKGDMVNVLKRGKILVTASVAVTANSPAFVTNAGLFALAGDIPVGYFRSNADANELVDLEVSPIAPMTASA